MKDILDRTSEKLIYDRGDILALTVRPQLFDPEQHLRDIEEEYGIDAGHRMPVPRQDPPAAQAGQADQAGAVGLIVPEARTAYDIDIEQRRLKDPPQQGIAGHGPIFADIDQIALGMTGTAQDFDAEMGRDILFGDQVFLREGGNRTFLFSKSRNSSRKP